MTRTTLRIGTWNILGRRDYQTGDLARPGAVQDVLRGSELDVLCIQEVHFFAGEPDPSLVAELRDSGLDHFIGLPLSPSHLDAAASLGLAIAARTPISGADTFVLPNRNPIKAQVRGKMWVMHDKGMLGSAVRFPDGGTLMVYSLHLFPFFEFGIGEDDPRVDVMWREFWLHCDSLADAGMLVLAGDFNHQGRERAADRWSRRQWTFSFTRNETTSRGLALDDIALSWSGEVAATSRVPTFSDHMLAIAEVPIRHTRSAGPAPGFDALPPDGRVVSARP